MATVPAVPTTQVRTDALTGWGESPGGAEEDPVGMDRRRADGARQVLDIAWNHFDHALAKFITDGLAAA
jgi:hypothetical protein